MLSVFDLLQICWKRAWLIAVFCLGSIMLMGAVSFWSMPAFETTALVLVKRPALEQRPAVTDALLAHTQIIVSEGVIRRALRDVPLDPALDPSLAARLDRVRGAILRQASSAPTLGRDISASLAAAARNLAASAEPSGDVIRIRFRFGDAGVAAAFTNAVAVRYAERLHELSSWRESSAVIAANQVKFAETYRTAYDKLSGFSTGTKLFSAAEQRPLMLARRSKLAADLAAARSSLAARRAQAATWPQELAKMKPLARILGASDLLVTRSIPSEKGLDATRKDYNADTPPQLLQRVYQDSIQAMLKVRADVAGFESLADQQQREIATIDSELAKLSADEAEFSRLKLNVDQARFDAEEYNKWAAGERTRGALAEVQMLQEATEASASSFPDPKILLLLGALAGLLLGVLTIYLSEMAQRAHAHPVSTVKPVAAHVSTAGIRQNQKSRMRA